MRLMTDGRKLLLAGVALTACLGFALNAQAQTCTISNWTGTPTDLSDSDTGKQDTAASSNRRYGGPCGLRVPLDGTAHYVTDTSPGAEPVYIARFYVFLDSPGTGVINLFAADDGAGSDVIEVVYEDGAISLFVEDAGGGPHEIPVDGVPVDSGWHSVELVWEQAADAGIALSVDGAADLTPGSAIDTTGITIENAHLGNLNGAGGGGSLDFDDFDSRRVDRPGRLCRGLTNDSRTALALEDVTNIFDEFATNGNTPAPGQPDYNEDGVVDLSDVTTVFERFATANEDCSLNS